MQLPKKGAGASHHYRFALYTVRQLTLKGHSDLAAPIQEKTVSLLAQSRAWEDACAATYQSYADRDAADEALDALASTARLSLASRSLEADKEPPYTQIFPDGVRWYTRSPMDEEQSRYQLLCSLLEEYLGADDVIVTSHVPQLKAGMEAFKKATEVLTGYQQNETLVRTRLETAIDELSKLLTDAYGILLTRVGKLKAEAYFRKAD